MINVIVVLPKQQDADKMKSILMKSGYESVFACHSGAQALGLMSGLDGGIVISGCRLADMTYSDLRADLPAGYEMLLLASADMILARREAGIVSLAMPFKVHELLHTLEMMTHRALCRRKKLRGEPKERSKEEQEQIQKAKELLIERNHMTEEEAHRYLQKCSMDSGTGLGEVAQMILAMTGKNG